MARSYFEIEKGLRISRENSSNGFNIIFGDGVPGGDEAEQDASEVGTIYIRQGESPQLLQKVTNNGDANDWLSFNNETVANLSFSWRSENVVVATTDTTIANNTNRDLTTNPFSDDDGGKITASDFAVGDYIIFKVNDAPVLKKVTLVNSPNIQVSDLNVDAIANNDTFIVKYYLPNPDTYELKAIINYNSTTNHFDKISDFSWNLASDIKLSNNYSANSGVVLPGDSVNTAISKIDGNVSNLSSNLQALENTLGTYNSDTKLGTFTGTTIPDNSSVKSALQYLETATESLNSNISTLNSYGTMGKSTGVGLRVLDSVSVDQVYACKWYVQVELAAGGTFAEAAELYGVHNGTPTTDATLVNNNVTHKVRVGTIKTLTYDVTMTGAGVNQVMQLTVDSGTDSVVTRYRRVSITET